MEFKVGDYIYDPTGYVYKIIPDGASVTIRECFGATPLYLERANRNPNMFTLIPRGSKHKYAGIQYPMENY
jgi:hypothetical protein